MIKRVIEKKLLSLARQYPVVVVTGPRQSGKTYLCRKAFPRKPYISFEDPDERERAENDPRGLLASYPDGAILDEAQRVPALWSYIQTEADKKGKNGLYILTGSQNILLRKTTQQSLAGRAAFLKLLPFSAGELATWVKKAPLDEVLWTGFYPRIHDQDLDAGEAMANYVATYLGRDVRDIISVRNISMFQKFLKLCAGRTGQVLNLSSIGNDLGLSHTTIREWISVLEASYIVFLLPAYHRNYNKRLVKAPKLYFYDTGLAAYLLGIDRPALLARDPLKGALFENFALMEIVKGFWNEGKEAPVYYFRDSNGNEVDILIERARRVFGVEVKAGATVNRDWFRGLEYLAGLMKADVLGRYLVYGGTFSLLREGVGVTSFRDMASLSSALAGPTGSGTR